MAADRSARFVSTSIPAADLDMMLRASQEIDRSLLQWSLALSPRERLRAATRTGRMLAGFRRAGEPAAR